VLAAAEECFRDHGFHGTSMAQISRAARMSPGHIYHYFKNKEDIILAIVRMDMHDTLDLIRERQGRDGDWLQAMLAGLAHGVARMLDPAKAAIALEVMSEAAHNPRVAEMICQMDQVFRREIAAFILRGRQARGIEAPQKDLQAKVEVMCAIFGGLTMRSICKPGADLATMVRVVNQAMMHLICD
jgi:AcrR family transcriptional regulator